MGNTKCSRPQTMEAAAYDLLIDPSPAENESAVHPILVGLTKSHDQRKGWIAWRLAVDL
jgi:hypothetical protein